MGAGLKTSQGNPRSGARGAKRKPQGASALCAYRCALTAGGLCILGRVSTAKPRKLRPLLAREVQAWRLREDLTELLICLMAVFSPWAFGATDDWAVWVMNFGGYALGALLTVKLAVRRLKGHRPPRWEREGIPKHHEARD